MTSTNQIELRQLKYFVKVAEELHFGRAAQQLHMTQPPLSQAIQSLESVLGASLFIRNTRKISLSAAGLAVLPEAIKILKHAQSLSQLAIRAASGEIGHLSLGFVSIADYSVLPPALQQFRMRHEEVKIHLQEATSNVLLTMLEKSEIDIGLIIPPLPESSNNIINYKKICTEPLVLAIHESIAKKKNANLLASYNNHPLIIFPRHIAPALHDAIFSCFYDVNITPLIAQEAIQMQTIIALVSANIGIALVPQSVSNLKRQGVIYQEIKDTHSQVEIGLAWRKENSSPVLQAFLNLF